MAGFGKPLDSSNGDRSASVVEVVAIGMSALWLVGSAVFFLVTPSQNDGEFDSLRFVMTLVAVFLPIAVIWVAALASRSARIYREETDRLRDSIDSMRQAYMAEREARLKGLEPTVERKLDAIAQTTQKTETTLATFTSSRGLSRLPSPVKKSMNEDQPALALGTTAEELEPPLPRSELIRALNFPDNEKDVDGFAALRRALKDRQARQLVQASQDVLTLLSQDGIYMDDMRPDRARPEIWRRFAKGERGKPVAALGGVRDRSCLALTAGRMRNDAIFRDSAHHFLRRFDQMLVVFEPDASDEDFVDLSETRTARAFMLLGRVTGAFD